MKKLSRVVLAASALVAALCNQTLATTLSTRPTDDSEAASDKPSSNFGYNGTLRVDTQRVAYLRFDLASLAGVTVESATLRLYAVNSVSGTETVKQMVESPWTEGTLTWRNRPTSVKATVGSFGRTAQNTWINVDAKAAITEAAGAKLTFSIVGTNKSTLYLSSGESASNPPELVVVYSKPADPPPVSLAVGINLATPADWGTEYPFVDLMKLSDGWHTQCDKWSGTDPSCTHPNSDWDTLEQGLLDLDVNGWPRSLPAPESPTFFTRVATLVPAGLSPTHPSDRLIVKYPGSGEVQYKFDGCTGAVVKGVDPSNPNLHRDIVDVRGNAGSEMSSKIHVAITNTDAGDPIRNIQVTPAGGSCSNDAAKLCDPDLSQSNCANQARCDRFEDVAATQPFHPRFLANIKPFTQIRTMEFQNINESLLSVWSDRSLPSHKRWTAHDNSDGVPIEVIAQLANTTDLDLWLNVPSRASNDLVIQMANLLKSTLEPQRRLTLEYSNEAWNTAFGTNGTWIESQGVATWPQATDHPFLKRLNWYGKRAGEVCKLWKTAWGAADSARVTCVAGGQSASADFTRIMLDCPLNDHRCYDDVDGLAIAPYFGYYLGSPANGPVVATWPNDLNLLFSELTVGGTPGLTDAPVTGALNQAVSELNSQLGIARERGLTLCGYEGGQHLVGFAGAENNAALTDRFTAANRDPRMGQVYVSYLQKWQESGAGPLMLFNSAGSYSKWGSWGLLEYCDQPASSSPKYKAVVQDFLGKSLP